MTLIPKRRKRRARFGEVVAKLGDRATAKIPSGDRIVQQQARNEAKKVLLKGGKNKGEQLGFGATTNADPTVGPPPAPPA